MKSGYYDPLSFWDYLMTLELCFVQCLRACWSLFSTRLLVGAVRSLTENLVGFRGPGSF